MCFFAVDYSLTILLSAGVASFLEIQTVTAIESDDVSKWIPPLPTTQGT